MALILWCKHDEGTGSTTENLVDNSAMSLGAGVGWGSFGTTHDAASNTNETIATGITTPPSSVSGIIHFRMTATTDIDKYCSLFSMGGVFQDNTKFAIGFYQYDEPTPQFLATAFLFGRNGSTLVGAQGATQKALLASTTYRVAFRWTAGDGQIWHNESSWTTTTDSPGTHNGTDQIRIAGPSTFNSADQTAPIEVIYSALWNEFVDSTTLLAYSADPTGIDALLGGSSIAAISSGFHVRNITR